MSRASAATGDEREKLWSELIAYVHDDLVGHVSDTNLDLHAYNLVALTV